MVSCHRVILLHHIYISVGVVYALSLWHSGMYVHNVENVTMKQNNNLRMNTWTKMGTIVYCQKTNKRNEQENYKLERLNKKLYESSSF